MSEKEQNKPETLEGAAVRRFKERLGNDNDGAYFLGFKDGADYATASLYTADQCAKMLSALRQRCAELPSLDDYEGLTPYRWIDVNDIEAIDVHQFIPKK